MIAASGNVKGGVSKPALRISLKIAQARSAGDSLMVDGDCQSMATAFSELLTKQQNRKPGHTLVSLHGAGIRTQIRQPAPKDSDTVVDVGGRNIGALRTALTVAYLSLPRTFDLWGVDQTAKLIKKPERFNRGTFGRLAERCCLYIGAK